MISLFACEDMPEEAELLRSIINAVAQRRGIDIELHLFESGEQLLMNFNQEEATIVLLDIIMGEGMGGMDTARAIRSSDPDIPLVFLTSSTAYAIESYAVQATHYLVKPLTEEGLEEVLDRCKKLLVSSRRTIDFTINRTVEHVLMRDIVYAEVFGNRATVHLKDRVLTTYTPLSSLLEETGTSFIRCHRSFVVNMDYVARVQGKEFLMTSGARVPIRTNGRSDVVTHYQEYLAQELDQQYSTLLTFAARTNTFAPGKPAGRFSSLQ